MSEALIEHNRVVAEYLRHLTTLSTGSIILLSAFLEKLFPHPSWKGLVAVSLISFMLSIVASIVGYTVIIASSSSLVSKSQVSEKERNVGAFGIIITWLGFLIGIISFTIFAVKNLL